jgi:methionyl-tRNA formyltransferase
MRIIFMGTPDFAVPILSQIIAQGHEVCAVYTRAPKAAGRGMEIKRSPVHELALHYQLPVHTPTTLRGNDAEAAAFAAYGADVAVVVAYGLILPAAILAAPVQGCLNIHASLLPRWRGAAPIQRAIMAGDQRTGVMVMRMEEGLDTGPIAMAEYMTIEPTMNAQDVHDRLSHLGADMIARALAALARGSLHFEPQSQQGVCYAHKIDKAEARLNWRRSAVELHNQIRGLSPVPGAYFCVDVGRGIERVKVLRADVVAGSGQAGEVLDDALTIACGQDAVRLVQVQRAGKAPLPAVDFLRGMQILRGMVLPLDGTSSDSPS